MKRESSQNQKGQALLLMVMVMSLASITIVSFGLGNTRRVYRETMEFRHATEAVHFLNGVAAWLHSVYQNTAHCNPYELNNYLNKLPASDASVGHREYWRRSVDLEGNYRVSFGEINPIPAPPDLFQIPVGTNATGTAVTPIYYGRPLANNESYGPQDASITFWIKPFGAFEAGQESARYEQTVVLMNTCTYGDPQNNAPNDATLSVDKSIVAAGSDVPARTQGSPAYGRVTNITNYTGAVTGALVGGTALSARGTCGAGAPRGSMISPLNEINTNDARAFRNYLRTADATSARDQATNIASCMDINNDGELDEVDLNILDKALKGHLHSTATSYY